MSFHEGRVAAKTSKLFGKRVKTNDSAGTLPNARGSEKSMPSPYKPESRGDPYDSSIESPGEAFANKRYHHRGFSQQGRATYGQHTRVVVKVS